MSQRRQQAAGSRQSWIALPAARRPLRAAFSFTEIMFAVMILGIGFIMVAGIFPVALQQSKSTTEEITAAPIARGGANYVGQLITDNMNPTVTPQYSNIPATGTISVIKQFPVVTAPSLSPLWDTIRGNLTLPSDPRYGFICLYSRGGTPPPALTAPTPAADWKSYIQLYVFPVQARATPTYTQADVTLSVPAASFDETLNPVANLMARPVQLAVVDSDSTAVLAGQPDLVAFNVSGTALAQKKANVDAVVEGAYIVIADDKISSPATYKGRMNGRIFRLGARRDDLASNSIFPFATSVVYELQPGNDFTADIGDDGIKGNSDDVVAIGMNAPSGSSSTVAVSGSAGADAYLIGKGYDPNNPFGGYEGPTMSIGAYVTFLKVQ